MAADFIDNIFQSFNDFLSGVVLKLLFALIVILVGFVIGRMAGKLTARLLHEVEFNTILRKLTKKKEDADELFGSLVSYMIYVIVVVVAFNRLGITRPIIFIISVMFFVVVILALLLAIRDIIPNMISGYSIRRKRFIKLGDLITVEGMKGRIISIELAETRIETDSGDLISIPNTLLLRNQIKVQTKTSSRTLPSD